MATVAAPRVYKNFINGEWVEPRGGNAYENRNPANTDELVGMFVSSGAADIDAAVDAATEAYKTWRLVPAPKRAEILYRAAELLLLSLIHICTSNADGPNLISGVARGYSALEPLSVAQS